MNIGIHGDLYSMRIQHNYTQTYQIKIADFGTEQLKVADIISPILRQRLPMWIPDDFLVSIYYYIPGF